MENIVTTAKSNGWEAMAVAFVLLTVIGFLVWLVRQWLSEAAKREERMARRIDVLEDFQRNTLTDALNKNSQAVQSLCDMLNRRPCLIDQK